jgi:transcriptional regulator with XRE-family HTH domain
MKDVVDRLKHDFMDSDYRHVYDEGFLSSSLATQIKVLREERGWTQCDLANKSKMNQSRISALEDVNFSSWTIRTLRKLAKAFDLRLKISFEEFGTLLLEFPNLNRAGLSKRSFGADPAFRPGQNVARNHSSVADLRLPSMPWPLDQQVADPLVPTERRLVEGHSPVESRDFRNLVPSGNSGAAAGAQRMGLVDGNNYPAPRKSAVSESTSVSQLWGKTA